MLYKKLVQTVEDHSEYLTGKWIKDVKNNPCTKGYRQISDEILHARIKDVFGRLGEWLTDEESDYSNTAKYFMSLGKERAAQGIKSSEIIYALIIARNVIWQFILEQGCLNNAVDLYEAGEFQLRVTHFFDKAVYFTTAGHESLHIDENEIYKEEGFFDKAVESVTKWVIGV